MCATDGPYARHSSTSPEDIPSERELLRTVVRDLEPVLGGRVTVCELTDEGCLQPALGESGDIDLDSEASAQLSAEAIDAILDSRTVALSDTGASPFLGMLHAYVVPLAPGGGRWVAVLEGDDPLDERTLALLEAYGRSSGAALAATRSCVAFEATERLSFRLKEAIAFLTQSSGDAVMALDLDGRITNWNEAAERLLGWSASEVVGEVLPFVHEDRRALAVRVIRELASGHGTRHPIESVLRKDGVLLPVVSSSLPLVDRHGVTFGVSAILRPVSRVADAPGTCAVFGALIERGLMGPAASLAGYVQLLQRPEIIEQPEHRERVIRTIAEQTLRLTRSLDQVLTIARLESDELSAVPTRVDVETVLSLVAQAVSQSEPDKEIVVEATVGLPEATFDNALIQDAVGGLAGHSAARCGVGGRVVLSAEYDGDAALCIHVTDDGPDLTPDEATGTFAHPSAWTSREVHFGPYLAHLAALVHGGETSASLPPQGGGRFTLRLPA